MLLLIRIDQLNTGVERIKIGKKGEMAPKVGVGYPSRDAALCRPESFPVMSFDADLSGRRFPSVDRLIWLRFGLARVWGNDRTG